MSNPYESPKSRNDSDSTQEAGTTWRRRFALVLVIMIALNASRLWFTWRAFQLDGMEKVGFPFVFFERGGFSYHESWYYEMLAMDVGIAFVAAYVIAYVLRDGWGAAFRNIQTWGLDDIYEEKYADPDCEIETEPNSEPEPPITRNVKL